jgi:hypothetical protein
MGGRIEPAGADCVDSVIYVSGGAAFRDFKFLKHRSTVAAGIS